MTKGVVYINIEIKEHNCFKDFVHKIFDWSEDLMLSVFEKLPETMIPQFLMKWIDGYTSKRISQLQQESIKNTWKMVYLQKAVDDIADR